MRSTRSIFTRLAFVLLLLGSVGMAEVTSEAKDRRRHRCEQRCDDTYKIRKYECKRLRGRERSRCEREVKDERHLCKDRCR